MEAGQNIRVMLRDLGVDPGHLLAIVIADPESAPTPVQDLTGLSGGNRARQVSDIGAVAPG